MGMYTGFRVDVTVKPEYREMVNSIMEYGDHGWKDFVHQFPFLAEFSRKGRANFIPFGSLCYMPEEWDNNQQFQRGFDPKTGRWTFSCSLKNYESEIELFCDSVLSVIAESGCFEMLYEEWEYQKVYLIEDFDRTGKQLMNTTLKLEK